MNKLCEVCLNPLDGPLLDLGSYPLCDDLIRIDSLDSNRFYRQAVVLCRICLTASQVYPVPKLDLFKPNYHYRARLTNDVLNGMSDLIGSLAKHIQLNSSSTVLDIGCNDGSLLNIFKNKFNCQTIGLDPTDAIDDAPETVDHKIKAYFDADSAGLVKEIASEIDVITFTNVFAHIEDLQLLCSNIKTIMMSKSILVIENHYLGSILEKNQFDTFYHEHPRTYSLRSFLFIAKSLNLRILNIEFPSRYAGNIRILMGMEGKAISEEELEMALNKERDFCNQYSKLQNKFEVWNSKSKELLEQILNKHGKVLGKALPGRAVMLINSLSLNENLMPFVMEREGSPKIGHFVPGTKIPIIPDTFLEELKPEIIIVWAWHIIDEVVSQLERMEFKGEVWVPLPEFKRIR